MQNLTYLGANPPLRAPQATVGNAPYADGSVHVIKSSISGVTWRALGTIGSGEAISADAF